MTKVKSSKGVVIDFDVLMARSGDTIATGNARMNARGDKLTHGGLVERRAEEIAAAHYATNSGTVTSTRSLSSIEDEILSPEAAMAALKQSAPDIAATLDRAPVKKKRKTTTDGE